MTSGRYRFIRGADVGALPTSLREDAALDALRDGRGAESSSVSSQRPTLPRIPINVLLVDDDPLVLATAAAPFRSRGDVVRTAVDGVDAFTQCMKEPPQVILSDINMPNMDGWQLVRVVRSQPALANLRFLFFSDLSGESERFAAFRLGVDGYVSKQAGPEELLACLDRVLRRVRTQNG